MATLDEYLEIQVTDGFKRQLEQEENILRSLPFFVTALALAGTIAGFASSSLQSYVCDWLTNGVTIVVAVSIAIPIGVTVFGLALAVWPKNYLYPADEQTLLAYVNQLQETYVAAATEGNEAERRTYIDEAVRDELRERLTRERVVCAVHNRKINATRQWGRSMALIALVLALALLMAASGLYGCYIIFRWDCPAMSSINPKVQALRDKVRQEGSVAPPKMRLIRKGGFGPETVTLVDGPPPPEPPGAVFRFLDLVASLFHRLT